MPCGGEEEIERRKAYAYRTGLSPRLARTSIVLPPKEGIAEPATAVLGSGAKQSEHLSAQRNTSDKKRIRPKSNNGSAIIARFGVVVSVHSGVLVGV